jgi:hypothetical protein
VNYLPTEPCCTSKLILGVQGERLRTSKSTRSAAIPCQAAPSGQPPRKRRTSNDQVRPIPSTYAARTTWKRRDLM